MEVGTLVLDLLTQKEFIVVGKFVDGQYLLMENEVETQYTIDELHNDKRTIIKDIETILRYSHQLEEI